MKSHKMCADSLYGEFFRGGKVDRQSGRVSPRGWQEKSVQMARSQRIIHCGEYHSDNQFIQPTDGYHYIYCELECENTAEKDYDEYVSYFCFDCYADGVSCEALYSMDDALSATISAGRKAKGTVAFEVPYGAKVVEVEYLTNVWTSNRIVFDCSKAG